jgi:sirohydrochlorin cobaltochelatase
LRTWRDALDKKIRRWPRTAENDPYKTAVDELAVKLSARLDLPVVVAHNEFCDPGIAEAIDRSIAEGAGKVIVLPTMLVRGNSHTEVEIHEAVVQAARRHPTIDIQYAWPFDQERVISLLKDHVEIRLERDSQLF